MFLSLFSKSFPFTQAPLSRPLLAGSDNTVISYYSHKSSYFWKAFLQKNEVINARVCWTDGITENFVTEFLIKVQTFFESICVQYQLDGWIKFTKNIYILLMECSESTQKRPLSKVSLCCRRSLPSWLLVGTGHLVLCNYNNHYYYIGLLQVQTTAQMVGYCYNKYECWTGASVSDVHACRHKFTDMTAG